MVVGRRRVAAASVATACALHVYVLPNTIFDRPVPFGHPSSFESHPHCPKVRMHSRSGYFSWVLVLRTLLPLDFRDPSVPPECRLSPSPPRPPPLSLSQFSISRPLHPPSGYTYTFRILSLRAEKRREAPGSAGKRWETPGSAGKRRAAPHSLPYSSLSQSIHPLLTFFSFCSGFLPLLLVHYSLVSHTTRIEAVYIVLRSVSKLRENDRFVVEQRVVWLVSFHSLFSIRILSFPKNLFLERI